jgi:hypothetical protein
VAGSPSRKLPFISKVLQVECRFNDAYDGAAVKAPFVQISGSSQRSFVWVSCGSSFADAFFPPLISKDLLLLFSEWPGMKLATRLNSCN